MRFFSIFYKKLFAIFDYGLAFDIFSVTSFPDGLAFIFIALVLVFAGAVTLLSFVLIHIIPKLGGGFQKVKFAIFINVAIGYSQPR